MLLVESKPQIVKDLVYLAVALPTVAVATTIYAFVAIWIARRASGSEAHRTVVGFLQLPLLVVVSLGLLPQKPAVLSMMGLSPIAWGVILLCVLLITVKFMQRFLDPNSRSMWQWIGTWVRRATEPDVSPDELADSTPLMHVLALPIAAMVLSAVDILSKLLGLFSTELPVVLVQALIIAAALALMFEVTTAKKLVTEDGWPVERAKYPRRLRLSAVAFTAIAVVAWSCSATQDPYSDLKIAKANLPKPGERELKLVLVNRGDDVRLLDHFEVQVEGGGFNYYLNGEFDIPVVADYILAFEVMDPVTRIEADPLIQFQPNKVGQINIGLRPDFTGAAESAGTIYVRVLVYADDGTYTATDWFRLSSMSVAAIQPPAEAYMPPQFLRSEFRFTPLAGDDGRRLGVSAAELTIYNGHLDELNAINASLQVYFMNRGGQVSMGEYRQSLEIDLMDVDPAFSEEERRAIINVVEKVLSGLNEGNE